MLAGSRSTSLGMRTRHWEYFEGSPDPAVQDKRWVLLGAPQETDVAWAVYREMREEGLLDVTPY